MRASKARSGRRAGQTCHRRWNAYGKHWPSHTRGGSRMRESRPYGSVRGACDETHVPTATQLCCWLRRIAAAMQHYRGAHRVEGCDHFSHDGDDDDLGFFVGVGEAIVEGFEGGTVSARAEGGHVEDITDRHPTTVDAAVSLKLA